MSDQKFNVIIAGAGVPGCLAALKLAEVGLNVAVVEKSARQSLPDLLSDKAVQNGRSVALMKAACDALDRYGVWDRIAHITRPLEALQIIDDSYFKAGKGASADMVKEIFYADEIGQDAFAYNIPLAPLTAAAQEALMQHESISFFDAAALDDFVVNDAGVSLALAGQKTPLQAALLIGADGRNSAVREQAGIGAQSQDYQTTALTCIVRHTLDHENISTEFHRPSGPFTFVPLRENVSTVVWCEDTQRADDFLKASKDVVEQALRERSRDLWGEVSLESGLYGWPLMRQQSNDLTAPRVVLLAEAAHVLSPIGAQGMNLSLRDVDDLCDVLCNAAFNGLDLGARAVLDGYVKKRRVDMWSRGRGVDMFHRSVTTDSHVMHKMRRSALRTAAFIGPVREVLMHEGLAPQHRGS